MASSQNSVNEEFLVDEKRQQARPALLAELAAVSAGGAIGALARFQVGEMLIGFESSLAIPWLGPLSTLFANLTGAFALGFLLGRFERKAPHPLLHPFLGVGCLGAYTTFSTFIHENANLASEWAGGHALLHGLFMMAVGILLFGWGQQLSNSADES